MFSNTFCTLVKSYLLLGERDILTGTVFDQDILAGAVFDRDFLTGAVVISPKLSRPKY